MPVPQRASAVTALTLHKAIEQLVYLPITARVGREAEQEAETGHALAREGLSKMAELIDEGGFGAAERWSPQGSNAGKEEATELFPELKSQLDRDELAAFGDTVAALEEKRRV